MSHNEPTFANFFALFDHDVGFNIDTVLLNERLRHLQRQFHPDKLDSQSDTSTQKKSSVINHAYNILLHPDSRANYLLELSGQEININTSIADLDFLDDAMDMRMSLDDAASLANLHTIQTLQESIESRVQTQCSRFEEAYSTKNWALAIDATQKLKFLVKLKKDMDTVVDELHQQSHDDDELYL